MANAIQVAEEETVQKVVRVRFEFVLFVNLACSKTQLFGAQDSCDTKRLRNACDLGFQLIRLYGPADACSRILVQLAADFVVFTESKAFSETKCLFHGGGFKPIRPSALASMLFEDSQPPKDRKLIRMY